MREDLPAFLRHLADRSPRTAATYSAVAEAFFAFLEASSDASTPTRADVEAFVARPRKDGGRRSAAGRNQELAALRAFGKFAMRELGWAASPTDGVPFLREPPRDPAVLTAPELRRLFTAAAEEPNPWRRSRNLALVAILSQAGLRVHEVVALDLAQVDIASATLVAVRGKGGTVHDLPLNAATLALVLEYIARRAEHVRASESALFISRARRLSVRAVQSIVAGLRERVGSAKKISPHTFRHSAATLALTMGSDLSTVAELLRHSDLNTTRRYLHLVDERRREAVRRLAVAIPPELLLAPAHPTDGAKNGDDDRDEGLDAQHDLDDARAVEGRSPRARHDGACAPARSPTGRVNRGSRHDPTPTSDRASVPPPRRVRRLEPAGDAALGEVPAAGERGLHRADDEPVLRG